MLWTDNEWATANVLSNFWIKIQCPFPIFISKLQVTGRANGNFLTLWRLEDSNNDSVWDALFSSNQEIAGRAISGFNIIQKPPVSYKFYRIFCIKGNGTNPGLSYIQFFCCLLYTSPSPRDRTRSRMPSSA